MASAPGERPPVLGRLDSNGRLVSADPELEALQRDAGSDLGQALAIPQVAAIAKLAKRLGTSVTRPAVAASADRDIDLWVSATPDGDDIALSLHGWTERPAAAPRLAAILGGGSDVAEPDAGFAWSTDEELRIISIAEDLAEKLGVDPAQAAGSALTRVVRLEEDESGEMPLINALAGRRDFTGQRATARSNPGQALILRGEVVASSDGGFAGFRGIAEPQKSPAPSGQAAMFDQAFEELLRSPVDRIIESAERIGAGADGPLRSDYASYGNDIASAARHLLSVLRAMREEPGQGDSTVDLAALAGEAVVMLESSAEEADVTIELDSPEPLPVRGQERAVIQILVNLMVNAIRHSPAGGVIRLCFAKTVGTASVTVSDQGPGIAGGDEQRIFERFERGHRKKDGTGLGLAISRRLARSMGGDVTLDSAPGEGARFTLTLPTP